MGILRRNIYALQGSCAASCRLKSFVAVDVDDWVIVKVHSPVTCLKDAKGSGSCLAALKEARGS
jgi:hypothetical protein